MMKLRYSPSESIDFEVEVGTAKAAFETIAELQEVFEGHDVCGMCQCREVRFEVREFSGNRYYKMLCTACRATLDFGQKKEGGALFPKVWDKEARRPLPNGGWSIYGGGDGEQNQPQRQQTSTPVKPLNGKPELDAYWKRWQTFFAGNHTLEEFNRFIREQLPLCPLDAKPKLWDDIQAYESTWIFDRNLKEFVANVGAAEMPY